MKKFIVFVLTALFLISPLAVLADDVNLDASYNGNNETVTVIFAIKDISDSTGVAALDCEIKYDPSALEFSSATVNIPDKWKDHLLSGESANNKLGVEDWSQKVSDGVYSWCLFSTMDDLGVTNDELFITLEFKPLTTEKTVVKAEMIGLYNGFYESLGCDSRNIVIEFNSDGEVIPDDNTSSGNGTVSDNNSQISDVVPDNDDNSGNTNTDKPNDNSFEAPNSDVNVGNNATPDDFVDDKDDNFDFGTVALVVVCVIGGLAVIGVVIFVIVYFVIASKRKSKS